MKFAFVAFFYGIYGCAIFLVLLVVALVGGGVWWGYSAYQKSRPETKAMEQGRQLSAGLQRFQRDWGKLPRGPLPEVVAALRGRNPPGIVYFNPPAEQLNALGELIDPWGTPFRIVAADGSARVYSCGPDRRDDGGASTSDDIQTF